MKKFTQSIGIILIILSVTLGIYMVFEKPYSLTIPHPLASSYLPFYAGFCMLSGVLLLLKKD